jgi:hypothetical protein
MSYFADATAGIPGRGRVEITEAPHLSAHSYELGQILAQRGDCDIADRADDGAGLPRGQTGWTGAGAQSMSVNERAGFGRIQRTIRFEGGFQNCGTIDIAATRCE